MKRRQLLKNLGLGAGFLVVGPSAFSLLQSCKNSIQPGWEPVFLSASNGAVLEKVLNIILPSTETPGAADLNLAQFVDSYMEEVATEEQQDVLKKGAEDFKAAFTKTFKKDISEATAKDYEEILTRLFRVIPERSREDLKRTTERQDPLDKDPTERTDFEQSATAFLHTVRELGIWGWKNSKEIGEEELWYDPVPGIYIPCDDVEKLGNGRAMSL
ncbi:gluconate 2-dehydrogenase subunit 3 family protein [Salinimicrobium xinjiangense]|uniref:gluconate 2-dehydrogenase subunit 3 family protein n=1 Tax=Salinimicrobium xinjiangense TaxID=438596 RepID=UPI000416284F|nr:gluconate 2-dehydrogenase subunit 3 family protein [Salinimicrobium xinjiangense]